MNANIIGNGIYSLSEAARYLQLSTRQLSYWFKPRKGESKSLLDSDYASVVEIDNRFISFLDMVQALGVSWLRKNGVSLQSIRKVYPRLKTHLATSHPFSHNHLLTDGYRIFIQTGEEVGDGALIELMRGIDQHIMAEIMEPYLKRMDFDSSSNLANRWNLSDGIIIDPSRHFGKPIVAACGISAEILARAYFANGQDFDATADWYGVCPQDVETACLFYRQYYKIAA